MKQRFLYMCFVLVFMSCKDKSANEKKGDTLPFFNSASFTPEWILTTDEEYKKIHTIPEFSFTNQNGDEITNEIYKGKIYVADFFFVTCPGICPILRKNMSILQDTYRNDKDILLLSHTVMPWHDSVPVLKKYASEHKVNSKKWNLVTGDKEAIYDIARNAYFADEDFVKTKEASEFIHTENFVLVDKKGRIRGVYNGTLSLEVKRLMRHITILKEEG